ncbi:MAG TPA: MoaD/ThiS family protein [Methylomirabilota bacterium]|nr:MoaD/ThiS family protein [Methylomirabilota bacterium]
MRVHVTFYSYFKELTGISSGEIELPDGAAVQDLLRVIHETHPKLVPFQNSTLIASGVEYVGKSHPLKDGEQISLFPPVQGG